MAAITLTSTGIQYGDGSIQATGYAYDKGSPVSITTFTSSGTYTVPSNCTNILVQLVGGGGGSAGYCESGGAGGFAEGVYSVAPSATYTVTIGGGGGGVGYYGGGGAGGTTSFGSLISATGGYGANNNYSHGGGHGGIGSGGQINLYGGTGTGHGNSANHAQPNGGGGSFFGGPGGKTRSNDGANYGPAYGSGAPGSITDIGSTGCAAPAGVCVVFAYK
jgi:hypothetical protein